MISYTASLLYFRARYVFGGQDTGSLPGVVAAWNTFSTSMFAYFQWRRLHGYTSGSGTDSYMMIVATASAASTNVINYTFEWDCLVISHIYGTPLAG